MSDNEVILRLSTVALLVGFLIYKHWERARKRAAFRRQFQFHGEVSTIDVAPLRPRLEAVRRDYSKAAHAHARNFDAREGRVTAARRKLGQLAFFHLHPSDHEAERRVN